MKQNNNLFRGCVPRLVLGLLKSGEGSGFELISRLENRGCVFFRQQEAAIYPVLHFLEHKGLVRVCLRRREDGRFRRCYRLTAKGKARLNKHKEPQRQEDVKK
ncbi:MAG: PadR family transcriptional regulator [Oscillospiraceae bacterium]|nr:PadR family transcriptional regulator [Oscillospiraceae bacterium]